MALCECLRQDPGQASVGKWEVLLIRGAAANLRDLSMLKRNSSTFCQIAVILRVTLIISLVSRSAGAERPTVQPTTWRHFRCPTGFEGGGTCTNDLHFLCHDFNTTDSSCFSITVFFALQLHICRCFAQGITLVKSHLANFLRIMFSCIQ